jgi:ribosomal protein S18 acetylase RimI-like enzyme
MSRLACRAGIGSLLLEVSELVLRKLKPEHDNLSLHVRKSNTPAYTLYSKAGYVSEGQQKMRLFKRSRHLMMVKRV